MKNKNLNKCKKDKSSIKIEAKRNQNLDEDEDDVEDMKQEWIWDLLTLIINLASKKFIAYFSTHFIICREMIFIGL